MMKLADMSPQEIAEASAKAMWEDDEASQALGMAISEVGPGLADITMPVTPAMTNGHKTCHGGYIFTLGDSAFAFACNSYNQRSVAQHASVTFIAPAREGDILTASAREVSRTGRSGIYDVTISNQNGEKIAEFRGHSRTVKGTLLADT